MKITNSGRTDDRLIGAIFGSAAPGELVAVSTAQRAYSFELTGAIVIQTRQTVRLHPRSYQSARMTMSSPLLDGSTVSGTLIFENAGVIPIDYEIGD